MGTCLPRAQPGAGAAWGISNLPERGEPQQALALLAQRQAAGGFFSRLRSMFSRKLTDDELHDDGLRLRALLLQDLIAASELDSQVTRLSTWAPRLLEGEARVSFLVDTLLKPLLQSGRTRLALSLLPAIQRHCASHRQEAWAALWPEWRQRWPRNLAVLPRNQSS